MISLRILALLLFLAALVIVSGVAEHANQSMKYGDNFKKLWEIQHNIIGQFEVITPGRVSALIFLFT